MHKNLRLMLFFAFSMILLAGCFSQPTPGNDIACRHIFTYAYVWEDLNSNGVRDQVEPPLKGVCIATGFDSANIYASMEKCKNLKPFNMITDKNGKWMSGGYVVGDCGTSERVKKSMAEQCARWLFYALPPDGYVATTETMIFGCEVSFGFVKEAQFIPTPIPLIVRIENKPVENDPAIIVASLALIGVLAVAYVAYIHAKKAKAAQSETNEAKKN